MTTEQNVASQTVSGIHNSSKQVHSLFDEYVLKNAHGLLATDPQSCVYRVNCLLQKWHSIKPNIVFDGVGFV